MKILFHKNFEKDYQKISNKDRERFQKKLAIFIEDPFHPLLNNHALQGKWRYFRSINISSDLRALYRPLDARYIEFVIIDTHSNLYS